MTDHIVFQLRDAAKKRHLEIHEIWTILVNFEQIKFPVSTRVFDTSNGALYLFDRNLTPHFKDDGVPYQLKKNHGRVREDYTKHEAVVDGVKMVLTQYKAVTPDKRRSRYCFCIPTSFNEVGKISRMHLLHYRGNEAENDEYQLATSLLGLHSHQSIDIFTPMRGPMIGKDRDKVVLVLKQPLEKQDQFNNSLIVKFGDVPTECEIKNPFTIVVTPPEIRWCSDMYKEVKIRIIRAYSNEFIADSTEYYTFFSVSPVDNEDDDDDTEEELIDEYGEPLVNLNPQHSVGISYNSNGVIVDSVVNPQRIGGYAPETDLGNEQVNTVIRDAAHGHGTAPLRKASQKLDGDIKMPTSIAPHHNQSKRKANDADIGESTSHHQGATVNGVMNASGHIKGNLIHSNVNSKLNFTQRPPSVSGSHSSATATSQLKPLDEASNI